MIVTAIALPLSSSAVHSHAQGTVTFTEFPIPTSNSALYNIAEGPDGNLWFTEGLGNKVGRITPGGMITEFPLPSNNYGDPYDITTGPDGNLWFTEQSFVLNTSPKIGRITPNGTITEFPVPTINTSLEGITTGPDGNLWFTEKDGNNIGKITPSGAVTEYPVPTGSSWPWGITTGPDGNLWFTESNVYANKIGVITPSGTITEYPIPTNGSGPQGITTGPDGNLWFTESGGNNIGKITSSGAATEYPIPTNTSDPRDITTGPDGNLWFTENNGNNIGKITPSGAVTEYPIPTNGSGPYGITAGPDGNLWFTEQVGNKIGRVNLFSPTPTPSPSPTPSPTPPPSPQLKQLSSDTYKNNTSQHKTEVEPDTFSFGSTIVAAFQASRFANLGGSDNIGWATSTDNGTTWKRGFLSGITKIAGGTYDRASDPSVAYDAAHKTWMIVSIGIVINNGNVAGSAVLVSRSTDGLTWNSPVLVGSGEFFDKPWIVCDNTASSHYYGHCYIEWDDGAEIAGNLIVMATSTNGGTNWVQALTADKAQGLGGQPLVQPNGNVVVPYESLAGTVAAFKSTDGGTNWGASVTVAQIQTHIVAGGLRTEPLPSAEIDGSGKVYVVWQDCRFESNCSANDIVMSTSTDGTTWSAPPKRILHDPIGSGIDHFIPGLAVDKSTSGSTAHLVLIFYYYPVASCSTNCKLDVGFASSTNGGRNWTAKTRLAGPMMLTWLAKAPTIEPSSCSPNCWMVGDYISASFSGGKAYPVFAVAKTPSGGVLNEAMYTVVGGLG